MGLSWTVLKELFEEYKHVLFGLTLGILGTLTLVFLLRPSQAYIPPIPEHIPALQDIPKEIWAQVARESGRVR